MDEEKERYRVQIELNGILYREMEELRGRLGITTKQQFFTEAVIYLLWGVRKSSEGKETGVRDPATTTWEEYSSPIFEMARRSSSQALPAKKRGARSGA